MAKRTTKTAAPRLRALRAFRIGLHDYAAGDEFDVPQRPGTTPAALAEHLQARGFAQPAAASTDSPTETE